MQAVLDFINNHVRDIFIPLTALALLRVGMCLAQLKRMTHLREKKGAYHAVRGHCEELGVWFGALAGLLLPVIVPGLWYAGLALAIVGGVIGQRKGTFGAAGGFQNFLCGHVFSPPCGPQSGCLRICLRQCRTKAPGVRRWQ